MMSKRRFPLGLIAVVVAGAVLLSGCLSINSETVIKSDGSGSRSIAIAIDKSMMDLAKSGNSQGGTQQDPFADIKTSADKIPGATVEKYTDASGNEGVKVTLPFKSLDELQNQQFGDKGQSMDKITYTKDGNVITLNIVVNSDQLASDASSASGGGGPNPSATQSPEEKAMAKQMLTAMGITFSYALSLPGKIVDWQPKDTATYDAATNKIVWNLDMTADKQPDIVVKWDNSQKPAPISAPKAQAAAAGPAAPAIPALPTLPAMTNVTVGQPTSVSLDTLQKYAAAQTSGDQAAYNALFAGGKGLSHPLADQYPNVFGASDLKVTYGAMVADPQTGMALWTAQRTVNGQTVKVDGVDVLTFDASGKITGLRVFVDPAQFEALTAASK